MQQVTELIELEQARRFLLETWAQSRMDKLGAQRLMVALRVALELANEGQLITHLGFMSDCIVALTSSRLEADQAAQSWACPALDASLQRRYEDYVLGKFSADATLERANDELRKYLQRDLDRALAFALQQIHARAKLPGVQVAPSFIKHLLTTTDTKLQQLFDEAIRSGFSAESTTMLEEITHAVRNCGELLGAEDIFELSSGTALSSFRERMALRQVMQVAQYLSAGLPKQKPSGPKRHFAVATNILEEDLYPVGGFSSIANRGTMESLLRSELAYMETGERPDLFDIRYARDELLYYSRDENQFFRRRVTIMFVLDASLAMTRVKDSGATWQRIISTMAMVVAMVRTLTDWLSSDSLTFEILFTKDLGKPPLSDEQQVLERIFQAEIAAGRLRLLRVDPSELSARSNENARISYCVSVQLHAHHRLTSSQPEPATRWQPLLSELSVAEPLPQVTFDEQQFTFEESHDPWREALRVLLASMSF